MVHLEITKNYGNKYSKHNKKKNEKKLRNECSSRQQYLFVRVLVTASSLFTPGIPLCSCQLEHFLHFRDNFKLHFIQCKNARVLICNVFILIFTSTFFLFNLRHKMLILLAFSFYRWVNWISEELISCLTFCDF